MVELSSGMISKIERGIAAPSFAKVEKLPEMLEVPEVAFFGVGLGKRIGQRQTFVSKFELGERRLDVAEFVAVSRAIGADPYDIIRAAEPSVERFRMKAVPDGCGTCVVARGSQTTNDSSH